MRSLSISGGSLRKLVAETIRRTLCERYLGPLYHVTSLANLSCIVRDNKLAAEVCAADVDMEMCWRSGAVQWNRRGEAEPKGYVCLTRDKNYNIRGNREPWARITLDGEALANLRGSRMYPVNYSGKQKILNRYNEYEERVFCDIEPLDRYVSRIDVCVGPFKGETNWDNYATEEMEDEIRDGGAMPQSQAELADLINARFVDIVVSDPRFKGKVFVS